MIRRFKQELIEMIELYPVLRKSDFDKFYDNKLNECINSIQSLNATIEEYRRDGVEEINFLYDLNMTVEEFNNSILEMEKDIIKYEQLQKWINQ